MRTYSQFATNNARAMLYKLISQPPVAEYREAMYALGNEFSQPIAQKVGKNKRIMLICTNEDADFLAAGLIEGLRVRGFDHVALTCFWNDRVSLTSEREIAPIVRRYSEPTGIVDVFIVAKSIISSGCVVRTNLSELVYDKNPSEVLIVAPVILRGAEKQIRDEFPPSVSEKFEFYWFAEDNERKENGEVVPGIGGSVYELLEVGTSATKNNYIPEIVKRRRVRLSTTGQKRKRI